MKQKFKIGETVVEPTLGICTIEGVKRQVVDEKERDFFVFQSGNARVLVPRDLIEKRGIRHPMTKDEVRKIINLLKVPVSPSREDAKMQYMAYRETMKSGDPVRITKLLRDLYTLEQSDELKGKEREIMEQAKKFLVDEITFIRGASKTSVSEQINDSLRQMYKKKLQKERAKAKKSASSSANT
jgi:CarD family transcriptional regulator